MGAQLLHQRDQLRSRTGFLAEMNIQAVVFIDCTGHSADDHDRDIRFDRSELIHKHRSAGSRQDVVCYDNVNVRRRAETQPGECFVGRARELHLKAGAAQHRRPDLQLQWVVVNHQNFQSTMRSRQSYRCPLCPIALESAGRKKWTQKLTESRHFGIIRKAAMALSSRG